MNYFICNNIEFPYVNIEKYQIKNDIISIELIIDLEIDIFNIWTLLRQNLNSIFYLFNDNFINFNFVLTECYFDNNKLILKGETIQWNNQI